MTIGIAAFGPNAALGIISGLDAVEKIGRGAIGGFVSIVALNEKGELIRFASQDGGAKILFTNDLIYRIKGVRLAGLISSGPNRPEPLSQFIAAKPGVGIVTGHRMPQTKSSNGTALNSLVLQNMEKGMHPQQAIDVVTATHPNADAGFIAFSIDGDIGQGNCALVSMRSDQGLGSLSVNKEVAWVSTIHNSISPSGLIVTLANQVTLDTMLSSDLESEWITIEAGIKLELGAEPRVYVGSNGKINRIIVAHGDYLKGQRSIGLGDMVPVVSGSTQLGWLGYEPFLIVENGRIKSVDGCYHARVPVLTKALERFDPQ